MQRWTERKGGVYHLENKELNLRETADGERSCIAERGMDEKRRNKAFAPARYRTQGSAITCVLAAGRSGWSALALPFNSLLPSRPSAPHQHYFLYCSAFLHQLLNYTISSNIVFSFQFYLYDAPALKYVTKSALGSHHAQRQYCYAWRMQHKV